MRTIGERYSPAMAITDQAKADEYFEELVSEQIQCGNVTRERAEEIERQSLAYYAGYYGDATRARVEQLFRCEHPVFGAIHTQGSVHPDTALAAGMRMGMGLGPGVLRERPR